MVGDGGVALGGSAGRREAPYVVSDGSRLLGSVEGDAGTLRAAK
jgi:hypothetical protein